MKSLPVKSTSNFLLNVILIQITVSKLILNKYPAKNNSLTLLNYIDEKDELIYLCRKNSYHLKYKCSINYFLGIF